MDPDGFEAVHTFHKAFHSPFTVRNSVAIGLIKATWTFERWFRRSDDRSKEKTSRFNDQSGRT